MVIIKISGGLGNQLFQYAFGEFVKNKTGQEVKYDLGLVQNNNRFTNRNLDIDKLGISLQLATKEEIKTFKKFPEKWWRIERKLAHIFPFFNPKMKVLNDPHAQVDPLPNTYYDGYWQRMEYIDEVKNQLLSQICVPDDFSQKYKDFLADLANENSVSVHIRRDDYLKIPVNAKIFEVCDIEYYKKAIKYIKSKVASPKFYIFTQDMEWAKKHFSGEEFHLVQGNSAIEDLLLMSKCKHNIIANSTFSWWASYLNTNPEKIIIVPEKWYKNSDSNQGVKNLSNKKEYQRF